MLNGSSKERIYSRLPAWVQNGLVSIEGWRLQRRRYSGNYKHIFEKVQDRACLKLDSLRSLQVERLSEHFRTAATTPFWRERFTKRGVNPNANDPFAELAKLPVLSKAEVRAHASEIENKTSTSGPLLACHTSGTTGSGLIFYETLEAEQERWAVWWRYRARFGITPEMWCGYFGGRSLVPLTRQSPPFWRINRPGRQLMFSAYHLRPETVRIYLESLQQMQVPWIHGYPSIISMLARWSRDVGCSKLPALRVITTGAENLLDFQIKAINDAFCVPVHQHYGQAESTANFSEHSCGRLHVDEDFSYVEFIPSSIQPGVNHIVGTNWSNPAFPLFRYDTGDTAVLASSQCGCGALGRTVAAVDGRKEDYVVLQDGTYIGRLDHIFKDLVHIDEAQIYQPDRKQLIFRVVKGREYDSTRTEERLMAESRQRLGPQVRISIQYVNSIPRTRSGKFRFVVSDLPGAFTTEREKGQEAPV